MSRRIVDALRRDLHSGSERRGRLASRRSRAVLGCGVATALLAVGVGPANADRLEWTDASGDMTAFTESSDGITMASAPNHHAGDVTSANVRHGRRAVTMKVAFAQLRRSHFNAYFGKLRTDTVIRNYYIEDVPDARPRLYVVNKRFEPACGRATLDVDYKANTLKMRLPRKCLKRPEWVQARATSANDPGDGSNTYYIDDAFSPEPIDEPEHHSAWSARVQRR